MAAALLEPGVEVIQTFKSNAPTFLRPTLAPCIVGPSYEVTNVLNSDGTINSGAKYGSYRQNGILITQSAFPAPRGNVAQLNIVETTVRPFLNQGGTISELLMGPGESFLTQSHVASKAALNSAVFSGATGLALNGKVLVFCADNPAFASTAMDTTVTFSGLANLTSQNACDQINAAYGKVIATVTGTSPNDRVQLASPTFGGESSVSVRAGGSANALLQFGFATDPAANNVRVEGSGYRGLDNANNTTQTPWITFYQGAYLTGTTTVLTSTSFPTNAGLINVETGTFVNAAATAITFGSSGTIPLQVGDYIYADGIKLNGGEIMKVEPTRFRVGTINTALSTADSRGRYITKVYTDTNVGLITDPNPFVPKYVWFKATGIDWTKASPVAAFIQGSISGVAATVGSVVGTTVSGFPLALTGTTIQYTVTTNGVDSSGTFVFPSGTIPDIGTLAATISIPGATASAVSSTIKISTALTGKMQTIRIKSTGTANTITGFSTSSDTVGTGTDVMFPAMVTTSGQTSPSTALFTGGAKTLVIKVSNDGGVTFTAATATYSFTAEGTTAALVAQLNANSAFINAGGSTPVLIAEVIGTEIRVRHLSQLPNVAITVDASSTGVGGSGKLYFTSGQTGISINGQSLKFRFSNSLTSLPHLHTLIASDVSLDVLVADINITLSATLASKAGTSLDQLKISSGLQGLGSAVTVLSGNLATTMGLSTTTAVGSGRPFPDAYLDNLNNLNIGYQILRDTVTGYPLDGSTNPSSIYIQYKALRLDVSPIAQIAGVLRISDQDTLSAVLNPLTDDNPLGLATFLCMLNAPGFEVQALGVDDTSDPAGTGTASAYARAAALLQSAEVYAIAPLSQDQVVQGLWSSHVVAMSAPEQGGERIAFINRPMPTTKNPVIAASGTAATSTASVNQLALDVNPGVGLSSAGKNPALAFAVSDGVYIEFNDALGNFLRYNVSSVSGSLVNFNTVFTATQNSDSFYATSTFNSVIISTTWSLKVRGATMVIPGSNPARLDYSQVASTVSDANASLLNRRLYSVFPDTIKTTVNGIDKALPGFYACAAIAGMVAAQPPQQGFTNFPITGITGVSGTEKFSKSQLNIIAGGGTYILQQQVPGGAVFCRHQLSTDLTSIETRELSITKVVDFVAKFMRLGVRKYIGTQVINSQLLDTLGTTIHGMLKFLEESGVLNGSNVNNLVQDAANPDTILIDITLEVPFPCNYIKLTLVV